MNKVVIWIVALVVIVSAFMIFNDNINLAPKSSAKKSLAKTGDLESNTKQAVNPFVGAESNSMTADQFAFLVDSTDDYSFSNMPATSFFLMTAGKIDSKNSDSFFNAITKSDVDA